MLVASGDAGRGVIGRPHAGNTAGSALAGEEAVRSSDGTQRVGGLRELRPRVWLAVTRAPRPDEADRARRKNRGVGVRRTCRVRRPRSMPARARLPSGGALNWESYYSEFSADETRIRDVLFFRSSGARCRALVLTCVKPRARGSARRRVRGEGASCDAARGCGRVRATRALWKNRTCVVNDWERPHRSCDS